MKTTLGLLLLCVLAGCRGSAKTVTLGESSAGRAATNEATRPVAVEVFEVTSPTETRAEPVPAVIAAESSAVVLAKRDGIVTWLGGVEGARVKAGEMLARLDDDETRTQLRQAELEVTRSQFEERQYEALLKVNRSELARRQTLAHEGLTSQTEVEAAQYKLEVSQQEWEKTRLATRMAQARVEASQLENAKTVLRAPFSGVVTLRAARLGSSVVRNEKLFEIAQLAPLEVRFQLAQSDGWRPRLGETVRLALNDEHQSVASARLRLAAPVADAASNARAYTARLLHGAGLIPGTAVFVRRPAIETSSGWWIPRAAFPAQAELQRGASAVLLVVEGEQCVARTVWLNAIESDQVEVASGLAANDRIILAPTADLQPGTAVIANRP
jgi:RND family efflux transporter MFP subunit